MYVCVHVCLCTCTHVGTYARTHVRTCVRMYARMHVHTRARSRARTLACTHVDHMYVCILYVCTYVGVHVSRLHVHVPQTHSPAVTDSLAGRTNECFCVACTRRPMLLFEAVPATSLMKIQRHDIYRPSPKELVAVLVGLTALFNENTRRRWSNAICLEHI